MALETANTILDLNPSWPTGTDNISDGDNHIRMMKAVLQAAYPVGSVLYNTTGTNPGTYIGGIWEQTSQGRAIVGVGNNGESTWAAGDERGSETHTLTESEVPRHSHRIDVPAVQVQAFNKTYGFNIQKGTGGQQVLFDVTNIASSGGRDSGVITTSGTSASERHEWDINHAHVVDVPPFDSDEVGNSQEHNNIQPSKAVYVWERTA